MTNFSEKNLNVACDGPTGGGMDSRRNALEQAVPEGYKQTEVGLIPQDWNLSNIKDISLVPMQNGLFYEPKRKGTGIPLINVADMYKSAPIYKSSLELFEATLNEKKSFKVNSGDLFFTRSSVVPSGIAFCNIFEEDKAEVVFDSHLIRVRPNPEIVDARFLYLNCIAKHSRNALIAEAKTATMTTIDQGAINRCPVLVPPLKEQTAIANALSDVDALLTELEKLIAKKQAIKTATMQQLLTGKTRLPQFATYTKGEKQGKPKGTKPSELGDIPEDWDVVTLDEAANFLDGQRRPIKSGDRARIKGQYPYYGASGIVDYVNDFIFDGEFILLGEDGENILSRSLPLAFKASGKIWVNNHAHVMTPKKSYHIDFLIPYLESLDYSLLNSGTAQPKLNKQSCLNIKVIKPSIEEQTAIATILSDMDNEIQTLEQRLAKTRQIKQGMMQELLTGRTRLPFDKE